MRRKNKVAVIIVDMQSYYVGELSEHDKNVIITEQIRLIEKSSQLGRPVIVLEMDTKSATITELKNKLADLEKHFEILKPDSDGFCNHELEFMLRRLSVTHLIITGINASFCVLATAKSALRLGFTVLTSQFLLADDPYYKAKNKSLHWYDCVGALYRHEDLYTSSVEDGKSRKETLSIPRKVRGLCQIFADWCTR